MPWHPKKFTLHFTFSQFLYDSDMIVFFFARRDGGSVHRNEHLDTVRARHAVSGGVGSHRRIDTIQRAVGNSHQAGQVHLEDIFCVIFCMLRLFICVYILITCFYRRIFRLRDHRVHPLPLLDREE